MSIEVVMPQMGESIAEGTLTRWLKQVGDQVERDEPLFEISTDKVDTEIPAPASGVLREIRVSEGETVPVQTVVALLDADSGTRAAPVEAPTRPATAAPPPAASPAAAPARATAAPAAPRTAAAEAPVAGSVPKESAESRARRRSSPLVRRIARDHGIDIGEVAGTGSGGRVTKSDILAYIDQRRAGAAPAGPTAAPAVAAPRAAAPPLPASGPEEVQIEPLSPMRRKIAEHMVLSKHTSPHVTTVFEVDMTRVARLIAENKESFLRENGVKLTFLPFVMKATIGALREFPVLNAAFREDQIHYFKPIHLGIAVALDDGLLVPVVRDAEDRSLLGLARAVQDLASRARSKKLQPHEVQGGTFTITNHGVFGSLFATPVINQPQAGILGVGTVTRRPVVLPETDSIAIRSMMYLGLSFDHRLVDGATADRFVADIKRTLESWTDLEG